MSEAERAAAMRNMTSYMWQPSCTADLENTMSQDTLKDSEVSLMWKYGGHVSRVLVDGFKRATRV